MDLQDLRHNTDQVNRLIVMVHNLSLLSFTV
jgi:hypothetical protein